MSYEEFILEIDSAVSFSRLSLYFVVKPIKNFEDYSISNKRHKALDLIEEHGIEKISYAYNMKVKTATNAKYL